MITRFVCLANSFKEGGRCLAGIELDSNKNPRIINDRPKWIRPICNTQHGEIQTNLVSNIEILDIIELELTKYPDEYSYQSENVFFKEESLRVVDQFDLNNLDMLCDKANLIFGNKGKAVHNENIKKLSNSLMFIALNQFEVFEKTYDDNPRKSQIRLVFVYNQNKYDLPVTDPVFLYRYQKNSNFLQNCKKLYVSVSLGIEWQEWYYKLIAGVIMVENVIQE